MSPGGRRICTAIFCALEKPTVSETTRRRLPLRKNHVDQRLCFAEHAADIIGQLGGVQDILSTMRQFTSHADICADCCGAIWSLAVNGLSLRHAIVCGSPDDVTVRLVLRRVKRKDSDGGERFAGCLQRHADALVFRSSC